MSKKIVNALGCEVRSVIRFLGAKNIKGSEIHRQLVEVYGDNAMSERNVRKWCRMFKKGRSNVHHEEKSGRPSIVSDELKEQLNVKIQENKRLTLSELHKLFPQVSRSLIHEIVTEHLQYKKTSSGWVPKTTLDHYRPEMVLVCTEGDLDLSDSGAPSVDGNEASDGAGPAEANDEGSSFSRDDFETCDLSDVKVKVEHTDDFCSEPETKRQRLGDYQEESKMEEALTILRDLKQSYSASQEPNDRFSLYGQHVASKLRSYGEKTSAIVEHAINNILFEADMGNYDGIHTALPSHDDSAQ